MKITELVGAKQNPAFKAAQALGGYRDEPSVDPQNPEDYNATYTPYQAKNLTDKLAGLGWKKIGSGNYSILFANPKYADVLKVFTDSNEGWLNYANWVAKHQSNPFVPKMGKVRKISDSAYAVRMEKLQPIESPDFYAKYIDPVLLKTKKPGLSLLFADENVPFLEKNYPQLRELLYFLENELVTPQGDLDLWGENPANVMRRGDTVVFSDPA